jgi:hypothetical protein
LIEPPVVGGPIVQRSPEPSGASAEEARLESEAGERQQAAPKRINAYAINKLAFQIAYAVCAGEPRCSSKVSA